MKLFKTPALYVGIAGSILFALLVVSMNYSLPSSAVPIEPSVNPYQDAIAAAGIIEAADKNIHIGTPEDGIVCEVFVHVGELVQKGKPLYRIDCSVLEATLLSQQANVEVAKANLAKLQDQLNRLSAIEDPRAISAEEIKGKEHDVDIAKAELNVAIATVLQTNKLIAYRTVRAPKEGMILQSSIREGEFAERNSKTMMLGDLSHIQVKADIDEQNAGWFNPKAKAVAYPKNNTSIAIPLHFVRIEPYVLPKVSLTGSSSERSDTRVLQVIYSFEQPKDYNLYVGQQLDLFIER